MVVVFASFSLQSKSGNQFVEKQQQTELLASKIQEAELSEDAILLKIPAVDRQGKGVVTLLSVKTEEGNGKTLVDIDSLLFFTDTQESIITAKQVASDLTGLNLDEYDITYTLYAEAGSIGGPSAGAALTVATIASLQDLQLREDVMITGRVFQDGSIGEVSAVTAKAIAAKEEGASIFLVPPGQGSETVVETQRTCEVQGNKEICTIERVTTEKNIGEEIGIEVIEVLSIREALDYFLGITPSTQE